MRKKSLLILCHELTPVGGGAGNFTKYISEEIAKKSVFSKVVIITSNYKNKYRFKEEAAGINIYRLPIFRKFADRTNSFELITYAIFSFLVSLFLFFKYDFKFTLAVHGIPSGISALFLNNFARIPYGVSLRGGDVPGFLPQRYSGFHKKISGITEMYWKKARFITFNAKETYYLTKEKVDRANNNVHIIPNGVDCAFFAPPKEKDFDKINIVYSGRLTEQKNVILLLRAADKILKDEKMSFSVDIAGDGDLKRELEGFASGSAIKDNIRFHGWVDKGRLRSLYQRSHIFVLPSLYEGMSNSLLEAMACGLAVISTDFKGYDDLVSDNENGYLIESNNLQALSEKIACLLNDSAKIKSMGKKGREKALSFSWESVAKKYVELINQNIIDEGE